MSKGLQAQRRERGILKGILGGAVGRAVSLGAPFVVMPVLLRYLGESDFGIWMTVLSVTSMSMFLDFGIGNGLLTKLASAYGRSDFEKMRVLISSAYAALIAIALALLVLIGGASALVKLGIPIGAGETSHGRSIVAICLVAFVVGIPASIIQRILYAVQLIWLSNLWQVAGAALAVFACIFAVKVQLEPWQAIAAYSFPSALVMIVAGVWFFRWKPELAPSASRVSLGAVRELLAIGFRFLFLGILTSVALNIDNIIIAQTMSVERVAEYAVPAKLASVLGLLVTTLFLPLWPANGEALARGQLDWVRKSTRRMMVFGGVTVGVVGLALVALGKQITLLWMGREFEDQTMVLLFLSASFTVMAITSPLNMLLNSAGRLKVQIKAWLAFVIATVTMKVLLATTGIIWLIPLVTALGFAFVIFPVTYAAGRKMLKEGL